MVCAAVELPQPHLERLGSVFAEHARPSPQARVTALNVVPTPTFRNHAERVYDAWASLDLPLPGPAVQAALGAAQRSVARLRREQSVTVVWTGPSSAAVPVRTTGAVLHELITSAQRELLVVSFAAYRVETVVHALAGAIDRGVRVRLVLESVEASGGRLTHEAHPAFAALGLRAEMYVWPPDQRARQGDARASMHAKGVVADRQVAFVTSANLTGSAITTNMELGLLVRGGDAPHRIADHFDQLITVGVLQPLVRE